MPDHEHPGPPWMRDDHPPWAPGAFVFRRIIGLVLFLIVLGPLLGIFLSNLFGFIHGPRRWILGGLALLFLVGVAQIARNRFGRTWEPVGRLIEATHRLGDGDTSVRIPITEPGPLAAVSGSFNRMAARLEEEDERRRRLLADLGHELRTPLTVIRGEVEAVLDGVRQPEALRNVIDEVDLLERLLEDLRILTLAEAGRLELHREPTDLAALLEDVVSTFSSTLAGQGVTAAVEVAPEVGEVSIDPYRIRQVLANLIANAAAQMPDGGSLTVTGRGEDDQVVVQVTDTGPGIPEDRLPHVFDRFVKSADSTGSGLGLSIARDLVEAHGGTITADNLAGGGARFTIRLPVARLSVSP